LIITAKLRKGYVFDVRKRDKELGTSLSQFFEIKLKEEIILIENDLRKDYMCPGPDLNRRPCGLQSESLK